MDNLTTKPYHRQNTINQYNLLDYDATRTDGKYNLPTLEPVDHVPKKLQGLRLDGGDSGSNPGYYVTS